MEPEGALRPDPSYRAASALEAAQAARQSAETLADALQVSELRYRRLFETARDGILLLDSDLGKITDANPFMCELLGYPLSGLVGKELWEIGLLKDKTASQEAFRQLKRDSYIRYDDLPLQNSRGEWREVEFVSNLYRENGHTVIQCNIRDITDRRITESNLAVSAAKNARIAETLQRSMLQDIPDGKFSGLTIQTYYAASLNESDVGGDFFDAFALSDGKVAFVVGDVSGKGLIAAARTAEVKYALRAFLHEFNEPDVALEHLNHFICETHASDSNSGEMFIVLALSVVDSLTGKTVFTSAGAEPSIILRDNDLTDLVEIVGTPLGIIRDAKYTCLTRELGPGDTLIMTTDGITEARKGSTFLGVDGLAKLIEGIGSELSLVSLSQAIHLGARAFSANGLRDDVCLLLARRQ
jgi:PAS domain S-box-containing protein